VSKLGFEQNAVLEIRFRAGRLGVIEADAAAAITFIVEFGIALDFLLDSVDRDRLSQPVVEGLAAIRSARAAIVFRPSRFGRVRTRLTARTMTSSAAAI
jgi:hypothetical protein